MEAGERLSLEQTRALLKASEEVEFKARNREEVYGWLNQTLRQIRYEIRFALPAIAQHFEIFRMRFELAAEIENVPMTVALAEDGHEAEDITL